MPWDSTTLHVADLTPSGIANPVQVAGGKGRSVLEPVWDADGTLYFVDDHTHTNGPGARLNAATEAEGIRELKRVRLKKYLND